MILELILLFAALAASWYVSNRTPKQYPPTPPYRLPLIGHRLHLLAYKNDINRAFEVLYEKYSKNGVLAIDMGFGFKTVLIGTYDLVSDVFKLEETNQRQPTESFKEIQQLARNSKTGKEGIVTNYGPHWKEQRRFMLSTLRDFGFGKSTMEDVINEEVAYFADHLAKEAAASREKGVISVQNFFNVTILNVLWRIVAGKRYDYGDSELGRILKIAADVTNTTSTPGFALMFPKKIRKWLPFSTGFEDDSKNLRAIRSYLSKTIDDHMTTFDPDNVRDFIDAYLVEIKAASNEKSSFYEANGYENLINTVIDLFVAGSETTSSTLAFAILFMIRERKVQDRVREEIHRVIGRDRQPKMTDRLPYTEATIMEIQRLANIAPRGLPHSSRYNPVQIGPYVVPTGHTIQAHFTSVLQGEAWTEGKRFNPSRFLDDEGCLRKSEKLIPFSVGKRVCPGEGLARVEIFLFFVGLLQKFEFRPVDPSNPPPLAYKSGTTAIPHPFNVVLVPLN